MGKRREPFRFLTNTHIRKQLYTIYVLAIFTPILLIGSFLMINTANLLTNYHKDLLQSDNLRVKTILFEITTQVYNISEEISFHKDVQAVLTTQHESEAEQIAMINQMASAVDNYEYNYSEIESVEIYSDNPSLHTYKQYQPVTDEVAKQAWFEQAMQQSTVFWEEMVSYDSYGNAYWNLCLIRKIPLVQSDYHAVLVIRVSDNYLRTRMSSQEYQISAMVDEGTIFFATNRDDYGQMPLITIDYTNPYFEYTGSCKVDRKTCFIEVATLQLYQSDSKIYISTLNDKSFDNIMSIIYICAAIIALAVIIPGILIYFFTEYFTRRVLTLRQVMHQVSNEDYEFQEMVLGNDELSEAFSDLEVMVQKIKQKDAKMFEAELNEKELINEQQKMEFKMLASQINPHFLYNTLETIRMKAFTVGDKEVATAIKLLGKSMRYVLENMGTAFTVLQNELNHIEIYMKIQKLRFEDKFDYTIVIEPGIDTKQCMILPLLLQPIVENAVLHGLEEMETGGKIEIIVERGREPETLSITVSDNGCGMTAETLAKLRQDIELKNPQKKESIGLYNINQRVKLCYGEKYGMRIASSWESGTRISIVLPYVTDVINYVT